MYFLFCFSKYLQETRIQILLLVRVSGAPYSLSSGKDSWCMTFVYWAGGIAVLLVVPAAWITVLRDAALVWVCKSILNTDINLSIRTLQKKKLLMYLDIFY